MYRKEYPIRCKSCNEQLACYSEEFEMLAKEYGNEKALNMLQIMEPCSRTNMMNPMIILNIKEDRSLIEGLKDIDMINKFVKDSSSHKCEYRAANINYNQPKPRIQNIEEKDTTKKLSIVNVIGKQTTQKQTYLSSISTIKPTSALKPNLPTMKTSPIMSPAKQKTASIISPAKQKLNSITLTPISSELEIEEKLEPESDFVKIKEPETEKEFMYPTVVGIPTINQSESAQNSKVHISGKYYAEVLSGRTYICR